MAVEKRVHPEDGKAYTFDQVSDFYAGTFKKKEIRAYWDNDMKPTKAAAKAKVKAKAKPEAKTDNEVRVTMSPQSAHKAGCVVVPEKKDDGEPTTAQKHTFSKKYFRSKGCRQLCKVTFERTVSVVNQDGTFVSVAKRDIKSGEVVERGVLRGIDPNADQMDESARDPAVLRMGQDFLASAGFSWSAFSQKAGPPCLPSGALHWYLRSHEDYNIELKASDSSWFEGFEYQAVATKDIPAGTSLTRKVATPTDLKMDKMADKYHLSDAEVDEWVAQWRAKDLDVAEKSGTKPDYVHEDVIRAHAQATRSAAGPMVGCDRVTTLPHPSWGGFGVFAKQNIKAGEVVDAGLIVPVNGLKGSTCPYVFTWNKGGQRYTDKPNNWGAGSGSAMFFNSDVPANVRMYRFLDQYRYVIIAKVDIKEGEELMHLYASSSWRKCFVEDTYLPKLLPVEKAEA